MFFRNILKYVCIVGILTRSPTNRHCSGGLNFSYYHCRCSFQCRFATVCVRCRDRCAIDNDARASGSPKCCIANAGIADFAVIVEVGYFLIPFLLAHPSSHCYVARLDSFILTFYWTPA